MNDLTLFGRLTRDPEVRTTPNGKNSTSFSLAVDRYVGKDAPANAQSADFIPCVIWGKRGEALARFCKKGDRLLVKGELRIDMYTDKDGKRRSFTNVLVGDFTFIERRQPAEDGATAAPAPQTAAPSAPQGGARPYKRQNAAPAQPYDAPFDEEVPF